MDGWSKLGSFKEEEVLEAYVENGQNLDRQMGGGNSFWNRNISQVDLAIWRDKLDQTGGGDWPDQRVQGNTGEIKEPCTIRWSLRQSQETKE